MSQQSKKITIGIILIALTAGIYWLGFSSGEKKENKSAEDNVKQEEINLPAGEEENKNAEKENQPIEEKKPEYTEYQNQAYNYSVKFSDQWHMNNDLSEAKLQEKEIDDEGKKLMVGGQTFWSNYRDINKYSPSDHPSDFHILALAVYKDEKSKTSEAFAEKLGFDSDSQKIPFEINSLKGIEFVSAGLSQGNPRVAVIFRKDALYYVFNLGFIGGDKKAAEEMENIVKTFEIN